MHGSEISAHGKVLAPAIIDVHGDAFERQLMPRPGVYFPIEGPAIEANAHPHRSDKVAVVHNGIIENYRELKKNLVTAGAEFTSDTDTEVIAHLFSQNLSADGDLMQAAQATFSQLEGSYAIALIVEGADDRLIVARNGSPLAIGHGGGEMFVGSGHSCSKRELRQT